MARWYFWTEFHSPVIKSLQVKSKSMTKSCPWWEFKHKKAKVLTQIWCMMTCYKEKTALLLTRANYFTSNQKWVVQNHLCPCIRFSRALTQLKWPFKCHTGTASVNQTPKIISEKEEEDTGHLLKKLLLHLLSIQLKMLWNAKCDMLICHQKCITYTLPNVLNYSLFKSRQSHSSFHLKTLRFIRKELNLETSPRQ